MPIHAGSFITPTPSVSVPPRENRLPLEPFAAGGRVNYPPRSVSFVSLAADTGSLRNLTAPYPRRPSVGGSKKLPVPFPRNILLDLTPRRWGISDYLYDPGNSTVDHHCGH